MAAPFGSAAPTEAIEPTSIHVLAVGACPPWLPKIKVCQGDVLRFADAVRDSMGVPADQITTLINEQATAEGLRAAFTELGKSVPQGATVVIYYVGHGMLTPKAGETEGEAEETFVLWSDTFPFAALYAVETGLWMTGSELGSLVDGLPADSALVILDTCDAAGADRAILSQSDWPNHPRIALMSSSRAHEIAFADLTSAVFTRNLLEAMRSTSTMKEAFLQAQGETENEASLRCEVAKVSGALSEACTPQDATLVDPIHLAERIELGRR